MSVNELMQRSYMEHVTDSQCDINGLTGADYYSHVLRLLPDSSWLTVTSTGQCRISNWTLVNQNKTNDTATTTHQSGNKPQSTGARRQLANPGCEWLTQLHNYGPNMEPG